MHQAQEDVTKICTEQHQIKQNANLYSAICRKQTRGTSRQ